MGNRGILHDSENRIVRQWTRKAWVSCVLEFNGIKRPKPFSQGNYSELFFLDEATALAAGHRPCASCQRTRHLAFKSAWVRANFPDKGPKLPGMEEVDAVLHAERAIPRGGKKTYDSALAALPAGAFFEHDELAYLVTARGYLPWSFTGYGEPKRIESSTVVKVLTPRSIVQAFMAGFSPDVHASAREQAD